jgi:AraC family transcriptional regulator of adaptative response/methylated-DNA-[protein]-cysteine methyltransferase
MTETAPTPDPADSAAHHARVAEALAFIEAHRDRQPALEEVAAAVGLSPAHFQRVFSRWVGVSPKRYMQYLTLGHAKRLLAERASVLDAALEAGLSGPSRLHDLFLRWEAMTPGEFARGGEGLALSHDWIETPFGEALAMVTDRGLSGLAFTTETGREAALADMAARWPGARHGHDPGRVAAVAGGLAARLAGEAGAPVTLSVVGRPFQIKVWEALLAIPPGQVATYGGIARAIGRPQAVRAVGAAVGRNPIAWLIPCHRAIRRDGGLGGYHWGLGVKRAMLAWEAARAEPADAGAA